MTEEASSDDLRTPNQRRAWLAIGALIAVGLALRIAGTFNDLWLDEIWSIALASQANSAWDVIFTIRHDNNHWLNTLWLYATLGWESPTALRLPAVVFGTASIVLMAILASRRSMVDAVFASILGGLSYPLIHYSSEARGYAGAMFFALLAVWLAEKFLKTGRRRWSLLFWLSCVLGWLSHLTFLFAYLAILVWTICRILPRKQPWQVKAGTMLILHAAAILFFAMFYVNVVRGFTVGGGNPRGLAAVLVDFVTLPMGLDVEGISGAVLAIVIVLSIAVLAFLRLRETSVDRYVLYLIAIAIAPLLTLWRPVEHLHFRYFLVCVPFLLLIASHGLAWMVQRSRIGMISACVLVALFLVGNFFQIAEFLKYGRGQYSATINDLADRNTSPEILLTSDHDFRNTMVLQYHARVLHGRKRIIYLPWDRAAGANWLLVHRFDPDAPTPSAVEINGVEFQSVKTYPHSGLSGWTWVLFERLRH